MPLQSHDGCASCTLRTTSFNTSSSGAPEAASASTSNLKSSRSPVFSLIDVIPSYTERLPPMITPPRKEILKPRFASRGGSGTAHLRTALAGEKPRRVPHQDDAAARGVLRHADQLPTLARSLVNRLLQGSLRRAGLAGIQRSVLRVVALGLRPVGSFPLSLSHVLPPFFRLPLGQTFPHKYDATHRNQAHHRSPTRLLPICYYNVTVPYHSGGKRIAPSKCTEKAAVLDCSHSLKERGRGSKTAE